jgi:hypothetical protein
MKTPVVLLVFNRPSLTRQVFEAIRAARPPQLLVIADGPRSDKPSEAEKCTLVREIVEEVDWPCEVLRNYSDINLGCKKRVSSGIDWAFERVEEAIFLEDDCLPHPTFFPYCEELLEKYRYDPRIAAISGDNFQFDREHIQESYYFSRHNHIWGWASWRRAWQHYDVDMKQWDRVSKSDWLNDILDNDISAVKVWQERLQDVYEGKIDTWDYQWVFACWLQRGLTIVPNVNLIGNIGFGLEATHTLDLDSKLANLPVMPISLPLRHPDLIVPDSHCDEYISKHNIYI